jgi:hypothetical protein
MSATPAGRIAISPAPGDKKRIPEGARGRNVSEQIHDDSLGYAARNLGRDLS